MRRPTLIPGVLLASALAGSCTLGGVGAGREALGVYCGNRTLSQVLHLSLGGDVNVPTQNLTPCDGFVACGSDLLYVVFAECAVKVVASPGEAGGTVFRLVETGYCNYTDDSYTNEYWFESGELTVTETLTEDKTYVRSLAGTISGRLERTAHEGDTSALTVTFTTGSTFDERQLFEKPEQYCDLPQVAWPKDWSAKIGCTEADFVDGRADEAKRRVTFGTAETGHRYRPACLLVSPGQSVLFEGDFQTYPLQAGTTEATTAGQQPSPMALGSIGGGVSRTFTFAGAGDYLYLSRPFAGEGMKGMIRVR